MSEVTQRRLAAIVSADVVGYSRLVGKDEAGTIATLRAHRSELIDPKIAEHGGRIVKTMGDGLLLEFQSVVGATQCAVEVQEGMAERNRAVEEDRRITFRVGINLGDIIIDGEDILGDGVNVAARLQEIASPGGITISSRVHEDVRDRLEAAFEDAGEQALKNIARPVHVWRWSSNSTGPHQVAAEVNHPPADKPSIAVLPFDNMSGDPDQEFFADGLAEDIITALSKVSNLTVIARNSTFAYKNQAKDLRQIGGELGVRYVLEGSTRRNGDRIRITAQLIDTNGGGHIWAERYDRLVEDIFDLQDDITREIVTALRVELTDGENAIVWHRGTQNIDAWRLAIEAVDKAFRFSAAGTLETREKSERAVKLDPNYGTAWALLGMTYFSEARILAVEDMDALLERADECAERAMATDPTNPLTIGLSLAVNMLRGNFDEAVALGRKGLESNPGSADVRAFLGYATSLTRYAEESLRHLKDAMRLNPLHPVWYYPAIARSYDAVDDQDRALDVLNQAIARQPDNFPSQLHLASLYGRSGDIDRARQAADIVLRQVPGFSIEQASSWLLTPLRDFEEKFKDGLRKAGIPE
jgi:adenylate cyclase